MSHPSSVSSASSSSKLQVTATSKPPLIGHTVQLPKKGVYKVDAVYMHKDMYGNYIVRVTSGDIYSLTTTSEYGVWKARDVVLDTTAVTSNVA